MILNNGTQTFDPLNNPGATFRAEAHSGYSISMTLHTADQSSSGDQDMGTTWYTENTLGFGNGHCVDDVGPDKDRTLDLPHTWNYAGLGPPRTLGVSWNTIGGDEVSYMVEWYKQETQENGTPPNETGPPPNNPPVLVDDHVETMMNAPVTIDVLANDSDPDGDPLTVDYISLPNNGDAVVNLDNTITYTPNGGFVRTDSFIYDTTDGRAKSGAMVTVNVLAPPDTTSQLSVNSQDSNGNPITGYFVELSQDGNQVATGFTPATFELNNDQDYTVRVEGFGNYMFDHWLDTGSTDAVRTISITSDTEITAVYKTMPQPPTGLTATAASTSRIDLSWNALDVDGGSPVTGYMIERSDDGSTWSTIVSNTGSTNTTYSDAGLSPNTTYAYRVSAINDVGTSDPSDTTSTTTPKLSAGGIVVGPVIHPPLPLG
jgi:hypothetical protein